MTMKQTEVKEPKRICDNCQHFYCSPGGCIEKCTALRIDPTLTPYYVEERVNYEKQNCKSFQRL